MIQEYHRPKTLDEALSLLARTEVESLPMGGGTVLNQSSRRQLAVVDLQDLGLDTIEVKGHTIEVGATCTLQELMEHEAIQPALREAIGREATHNLRQTATLAGTIVAAGGRSVLTTALLALDARVRLMPGDETADLGEVLYMRGERLKGRLITSVSWGLNVRLAMHSTARTPADLPIVCATGAKWPSGRTRIALGGYGGAPVLAMDGLEAAGFEEAAENAYFEAGDAWSSAEYRRETAVVLARRAMKDLEG